MKAVVGEEALTEEDKLFLEFHDKFEQEFVNQDYYENRTIFDSLNKAWDLLSLFKKEKLSKINNKIKDEYFMKVNRDFEENRHKDQQIDSSKQNWVATTHSLLFWWSINPISNLIIFIWSKSINLHKL